MKPRQKQVDTLIDIQSLMRDLDMDGLTYLEGMLANAKKALELGLHDDDEEAV